MGREISLPGKLVEEIRSIMLAARENTAYQINSELIKAYFSLNDDTLLLLSSLEKVSAGGEQSE